MGCSLCSLSTRTKVNIPSKGVWTVVLVCGFNLRSWFKVIIPITRPLSSRFSCSGEWWGEVRAEVYFGWHCARGWLQWISDFSQGEATAHAFVHTYWQTWSKPNRNMLWQWEEARALIEDPHRHKQSVQTRQRGPSYAGGKTLYLLDVR